MHIPALLGNGRLEAVSSLLLLAFVGLGCAHTPPTVQDAALSYPEARRGEVVEAYHGEDVSDPYRWLEDPDSEESRAWIDAQNRVTQGYLQGVDARGKIRERLTELWNYERYDTPFKRGDRYFYTHNDGLQDHSVLYTTRDLTKPGTVLLDPNTLSKDGTVSLAGYRVSKDAKYLAYGLSDGGSDWRTWYVIDVETGKKLEDKVEWVKFSSATWLPDNSGFFYGRYPAPKNPLEAVNENQKLYFHKLGTPQSEDQLVFETPDNPKWGFGTEVSEDGSLLLIYIWRSTEEKNLVFTKSLESADAPIKPLIASWIGSFGLVTKAGTKLWFQTNHKAERGRLIQIDLEAPEEGNWKEIVGEGEATLLSSSRVGEKLVLSYLADAKARVATFDLEGKASGDVQLPGVGSVRGFDGTEDNPETFFSFTGFTTPTSIYRYDAVSGAVSLWKAPKVAFDTSKYETKQVFYSSKDGTRVPMFITHKKGLNLDSARPTILYGYGGFNISITPRFSVASLVWMEMGGVYAVANIRGGGEYGEAWHSAGIKGKKQNVFDDFIAAAQWLSSEGYTRPDRLAIYGGSNGGLLVGACITQRPELFGAAMPAVGVLDMLRYHKFTIGWAWAADYGTSEESAEMFKVLRAYSPLHNTKKGTHYPATLILTADHDDRVVPAHSFKFAAALQHAHGGDAPVLIRIETRAGHGAGKSTSMKIDQVTDQWSFLLRALKVDNPWSQ